MTDEFISGIDDAPLLRALAEDVPDMAMEIRNQLRLIADKLDVGEKIGQLRCRRCGEMADITIKTATFSAAPAAPAVPTDERAAFETWAHQCYGNGNFTRSQDGYISTSSHRCIRATYASVQMLWESWQARAALAPEQAAPVQAPAADFDAVWRTLPIPGEYDSMDAFDRQRWRGIARAAFDVGRSVRAVPEGMIDSNCHIAFMEAPPATSLDDFQLGWEAARKNVVVLSERWRWNLHKFLDVAAGEGYVLDGVDAATLYESVFPDEYSAALRSTMPTLDE